MAEVDGTKAIWKLIFTFILIMHYELDNVCILEIHTEAIYEIISDPPHYS